MMKIGFFGILLQLELLLAARVAAFEGSGPVTLTATAVGTAEHRSPPLRADGRPHPLEVSCHLNHCAFSYDGATAYDGDGSGFDLVRELLHWQLCLAV